MTKSLQPAATMPNNAVLNFQLEEYRLQLKKLESDLTFERSQNGDLEKKLGEGALYVTKLTAYLEETCNELDKLRAENEIYASSAPALLSTPARTASDMLDHKPSLSSSESEELQNAREAIRLYHTDLQQSAAAMDKV